MSDSSKPIGETQDAAEAGQTAEPQQLLPSAAVELAEDVAATEGKQAEPEKGLPEEEEKRFFVVGIGASAGGLEAIGEVIQHVSTNGMSFVVVQHLAPDHESILTQLLSRSSRMEVLTARDGMTLEPNRVYVIP